MTPKFLGNCACKKCEGTIREAVEQEDNVCDEVETAREFPYLGDRVSADGVCEAAVIARARCWWVRFWESGELLYGRRCHLRQKGLFMRVTKVQQYCMKVNHGT